MQEAYVRDAEGNPTEELTEPVKQLLEYYKGTPGVKPFLEHEKNGEKCE